VEAAQSRAMEPQPQAFQAAARIAQMIDFIAVL
jgi:hypothetical protein